VHLCGCLPVGNGSTRDEEKQSNIKQSVKRYSLKRDMPMNGDGSGSSTGTKTRKERTKSNTSTMTESGTKRYTIKKTIIINFS